jgi:RHS repeat-associated protein
MTNSTETVGRIVDSVDYTSDSTGQLLTASGGPPSETYSYDPNGNRNSTGYVTGPNNELLSDGTYNCQYDGEGNRIARWQDKNGVAESSPQPNDTDITIYTWDNRDRLTGVAHYTNYWSYRPASGSPAPDASATYFYDAFGRWVGEEVNPGTAAEQKTAFAYDGNQIVLEFDGTLDATQSDPPLGAGSLSHRYLWGPAVDQLMAQESPLPLGEGQGEGYDLSTPGNVLWALTDNENTIRDLATYQAGTQGGDGTTTVVNHRVFSAYGELLSQTNPATNAPASATCLFGYTGRPSSTLTTAAGTTVVVIQQNGLRWYDPATGDWLSQDPSGLGSGPNLYCYCGNGPASASDPSGLGAPPGPWHFDPCDHGGTPHFQREVRGIQQRYNASDLRPLRNKGIPAPELSETAKKALQETAAWQRWLRFAAKGLGMVVATVFAWDSMATDTSASDEINTCPLSKTEQERQDELYAEFVLSKNIQPMRPNWSGLPPGYVPPYTFTPPYLR